MVGKPVLRRQTIPALLSNYDLFLALARRYNLDYREKLANRFRAVMIT
jgi:hypothetical protein